VHCDACKLTALFTRHAHLSVLVNSKQWQQFRELSGEKEFLTRAEFRDTVRRNFGMMKEEWVKKYFRAFDRNDSGTIDFVEYVMGFAGMARVSS
jgi:hypothetical protein